MRNCSNTRMKSSSDFQLFKKQLRELLGSMFTAQILFFSEQPAQSGFIWDRERELMMVFVSV